MYVRYFTDDGIEFETREECEQYENFHKFFDKSIICLDKDFKILSSNTCSYSYLEDNTVYLYIKDQEALDFLSYSFGWEPLIVGYNYYNFEEEMWKPLKEDIAKLVKRIDNLEYAFDIMKGVKGE